MKLSWYEKLAAKAIWSKNMKLKAFKTWAPIIGVIFLGVHEIAHQIQPAGRADTSLATIAATIPVEEQSPIPKTDIAGAVAATLAAISALGGVARKIKAVIEAAKAASDLIPGDKVELAVKGEKVGEAVVTSTESKPEVKRRDIGPGFVVILALLPALALAQDQPKPSAPVEISLYGGAMQFAERGQPDKRDFVYRLTLTVPAPSGITLFGRADYTRTQDGGDLIDPKTFRSIEALAGGRKDIIPNLSVMAFAGVTWNRDDHYEPVDPRLWTGAAGLRYSVPGRGYVVASAGHHGPVGGSAFLGSIVYEISAGASWFGDVAVPLDASRFAKRPYTVKAGISARLKGWKF